MARSHSDPHSQTWKRFKEPSQLSTDSTHELPFVKRHGMKDIQEHVLQKQQMPVCEASRPMRRRVNLIISPCIGITGHAPMTGFHRVQFVIQLLTP
ncbi:hypothetical protein TNCV_422551 [Trichonephila clavipes]|nr:hypothetical protein TNCV_422551 [Trichonephila clavipes]